ncbi:uncharacterized protein [Littorina saxatilis]|uniref:Poly [ADP-ribose] polymerase n=1 Tax=Littorina saxatilis TaxID=31220 RepID=A0AAN9B1C9_9CAEN
MASNPIRKVIVKNLPNEWTSDHLENFLEVVTSLMMKANCIQTFCDVRHAALLTLEEPVSEDSVHEANQDLVHLPFNEQTLALEAVTESTCSIVVHFTDLNLSDDLVFYYFANPRRSGCGDAEVERCEMHPELSLAVVHFTLPEAVDGVLAKEAHNIKKDSEVVKVEPWYGQFHRPLLEELLKKTCSPAKPPVPPKPSVPPPQQKETIPKTFASHSTPPQEKPPLLPKPDLSERPSPFKAPGEYSSEKPAQEDPEVKSLREELEKLRLDRRKVESEEALKAQEELERLKRENEKLKTMVTLRLIVPSYQLRLLRKFAGCCEGCQVTLLEQEEVALFSGPTEECEQAMTQLMKQVQGLADDSLTVPDATLMLLETTKGRQYLKDMMQKHPNCSAKVQNSCVVCAALKEEDLRAFKEEFESAILTKTCTVSFKVSLLPQFQNLKIKLEQDYLVLMTLPSGNSNDLHLDGLASDVELAAIEVEQFSEKNRPEKTMFEIDGAMQANACRKWFSKELDEVKQIIRQNGDIHHETTEDGYILEFECRLDVAEDVMDKLSYIKDNIVSINVDLNKEFPLYSERALVVNGLHRMGVKKFCSHLKDALLQQDVDSLGDFTLPAKYSLPRLSLGGRKSGKEEAPRGSHRESKSHHRSSGGRGRRHTGQRYSSRPSSGQQPSVPCTYTFGNTSITLKTGDITAEPVQAAVNVVGRDLKLTGTALGSAFLKKNPTLAQLLQANSLAAPQQDKGCHLLKTPLARSGLPMSMLYHAVLNKMPQNAVKKAVKQLVHQCLMLAMQQGYTSIAFPPLGVGRRFGYGRYTVANAMVAVFQEFLQTYPNGMQNITIVVYDSSVVGRFAEVFKQTFGGGPQAVSAPAAAAVQLDYGPDLFSEDYFPQDAFPGENLALDDVLQDELPISMPTPPVTSDEENNDRASSDNNDSDVQLEEEEDDEVPDLSEDPKGRFEALICTANAEDCQEVIDVLLKELKTIFLWHETLRDQDVDTFRKLGTFVIQDISQKALTTNVHLSLSQKGLRLCGQKDSVHELLSMIRDKMFNHVQQQSKKESQRSDKLELPRYWKLCQKEKSGTVSYEKALDRWRKQVPGLIPVSAEETKAVLKLVESTWEANKAGAGKDARNLAHTSLQVTKVERLENPELWRDYCHKRANLLSKLQSRHATKAQCTPVENLPNSRGPLQTTANIARKSPLSRDIHPEVNEHYLFHGTKTATLLKIYEQGLDFRVASAKTMLGRGVYAAESSTKADQYTDPKQARTSGHQLTMILVRMLLGEPFIHTDPNPSAFTRPPCMKCSQKECACTSARLFDSVIDDSNRIFREFVVYEQNGCYPEYFITYIRK